MADKEMIPTKTALKAGVFLRGWIYPNHFAGNTLSLPSYMQEMGNASM
jgi:hypothetical protein